MVGLLSCCTTEVAPRVPSKDAPSRIPTKTDLKQVCRTDSKQAARKVPTPKAQQSPAIGIARPAKELEIDALVAAAAQPTQGASGKGSSPSTVAKGISPAASLASSLAKPGGPRLSEASTSAGTSPAGSDTAAEPLLSAAETPCAGDADKMAKALSDSMPKVASTASMASVENEAKPLTPLHSGRSRGSDSSPRAGDARRTRRRSMNLIDGDLDADSGDDAEQRVGTVNSRKSLSPGAATSIMQFVDEKEGADGRRLSLDSAGRRKSMVATVASAMKRSTAGVTAKLMAAEPAVAQRARRNSQFTFAEAAQTIIVFDWDDTLFPTTYLLDDLRLAPKKPMKQQKMDDKQRKILQKDLVELQHQVKKLLEVANASGKVVLVTLAKSPWVEDACANFFPEVGKLIKSMGLKTVYAQEGQVIDYDKQKMMASSEIETMYAKMKGKAIRKEVDAFYSMYEGQTWKNVISIGDSDFERLGTIMMTEDYLREKGIDIDKDKSCASHEINGHVLRVRTKTFKMMDEPMIFEVSAQVRLLQKWVPKMVALDDGFDVDLSALDDKKIIEDIEKKLCGRAGKADGSQSPRSRTK